MTGRGGSDHGRLSMAQSTWITDVRTRVDARLLSFFDQALARAGATSPRSIELVEAIATLTMRAGKRLRPAVVVAGFRVADSQTPLERTDNPCAAIELLQTYFLIHDDWMDRDDERRGGLAVHAALRKKYGDAHLGDALGVLAGDLASSYASELLASTQFPDGSRVAALHAFAQIQEQVVFGQHLDLIADEDVERMHDLKTGSYTVRGPLRLGALLGGAPVELLATLDAFARPVGLAFQLRDDLLGAFGDQRALGKPVGADLRAGKRNAVITEAEQRMSTADSKVLGGVLGKRDATEREIMDATDLLASSGAREAVETRITKHVAEAREILRNESIHPEGRRMLLDLVDLMTNRTH